jgi:hypothetical protein
MFGVGEGEQGSGNIWQSSPAEWFAGMNSTIQDNNLLAHQKTWEEAAAALGPLPESLGKVWSTLKLPQLQSVDHISLVSEGIMLPTGMAGTPEVNYLHIQSMHVPMMY